MLYLVTTTVLTLDRNMEQFTRYDAVKFLSQSRSQSAIQFQFKQGCCISKDMT